MMSLCCIVCPYRAPDSSISLEVVNKSQKKPDEGMCQIDTGTGSNTNALKGTNSFTGSSAS